MIQENTVTDDRAVGEDADLVHPLDRRAAVAADHFDVFVDRLRRMNLHWQVAFLGIVVRLAQQLRADGIDLGRRQHACQPA